MLAQPEAPELSVWKRGYALAAAIMRFARPEAAKAYQEARATKLEERPLPALSPEDGWAKAVLALNAHLQPAFALGRVQSERYQVLVRELVSHLRQGRLVAYGYSLPRGPEDPPRRIPPDMRDSKINWNSSQVEGHGLTFVAVRVVHPKWESAPYLELQAEPTVALPPRGRPPVKAFIQEAYRALLQAGVVDFRKPRSRLDQQIRDWLCKRHPGRKDQFAQLSREAVRKAIGDLFEAGKSGLQ